jgi:hypothetical protein
VGPPPQTASRTGSAIALSATNDALFLADEVHPALFVMALPLAAGATPREIALPGAPAQVVATPDRVLVTIRQPSLLVVLDPRRDLKEIGRVVLPNDAWGLALSPDESLAMVTSAWSHQVSLVGLEKLEKQWSTDVAREPRAVVFSPDSQSAWVSHLTSSQLTKLVWYGDKANARQVPLPSTRGGTTERIETSLSYALALSADGHRLYSPRHALTRAGGGSWFGAGTVDTMQIDSETRVSCDFFDDTFVDPGFQGAYLSPGDLHIHPASKYEAFVQPRAAVYRASTRSIIVASEGEDKIVEMDGDRADPALARRRTYALGARTSKDDPPSCGAPGGLALSRDEQTLFVLCRTTFEVAAVPLETRLLADAATGHGGSGGEAGSGGGSEAHAGGSAGGGEVHAGGAGSGGNAGSGGKTGGAGSGGDRVTPPAGAPLVVGFAKDPLPEKEAWGRRLFHDARDPLLSGGMGCAGCHPDGRDDGHVWLETKSPITTMKIFVAHRQMISPPVTEQPQDSQARQTPMLAGRITPEGPYGWHAQNAFLSARVLDGFMLHRWKGTTVARDARTRLDAIAAFARAGLVPPARDEHPATPEETRGKELFFQRAGRLRGLSRAGHHVHEQGPVPADALEDHGGRGRRAALPHPAPALRRRDPALLPRRQRPHARPAHRGERRPDGAHKAAHACRSQGPRRLPEDPVKKLRAPGDRGGARWSLTRAPRIA